MQARAGTGWTSRKRIRGGRLLENEWKDPWDESGYSAYPNGASFFLMAMSLLQMGEIFTHVALLQALSNHGASFPSAIVFLVGLFTTAPLNGYNLQGLPHWTFNTSKIVLRRLKMVNWKYKNNTLLMNHDAFLWCFMILKNPRRLDEGTWWHINGFKRVLELTEQKVAWIIQIRHQLFFPSCKSLKHEKRGKGASE